MKKWNHALGTGVDGAKSSGKVVVEWQITILISFFRKKNFVILDVGEMQMTEKLTKKHLLNKKISKKDGTGILWLLLVRFAGVKLGNFCYIGRSLMLNWISWAHILWNMHCNLWFNWLESRQSHFVRWSVLEIPAPKSYFVPIPKKSALIHASTAL